MMSDSQSDGPKFYHLNGHPIKKVEVMGVIVGVIIRHAFVSYSIDDGSGILHCNCWYNQHAAFASPGGLQQPISDAMQSLRRVTPTTSGGFVSTPVQILDMGNVIRVRGRITEYLGRRGVAAESVYVDTSSNAEVMHWLEVINLFECVYSQPSQILLESRASHLAESAQLAAACTSWIADHGRHAFTRQSLMETKELADMAAAQARAIRENQKAMEARVERASIPAPDLSCTPQQCMQSAIDYMLQLGTVLRMPSSSSALGDQYEVTSLRRHVIPLVFRIIASSPSDVGIHRDAVVAAIHSQHHANLSTEKIDEAIEYLSAQSDICAWSTPHTYICSNPAAAEGLDTSCT